MFVSRRTALPVRHTQPTARKGRPTSPQTDNDFPMKWLGTKNLGMLLLGIWLVLTGALAFVHVSFANTGLILAALALAAGILILLGR